MKELIEKLEQLKEDLVANLEYNHIITINEAIQALTSVKSEQQNVLITEEHIKNAYNATISSLPSVKSESAEAYEIFAKHCANFFTTAEQEEATIQAMHDFANAERKQHAIGFARFESNHKFDFGTYAVKNDRLSIHELYDYYLTTLNNNER